MNRKSLSVRARLLRISAALFILVTVLAVPNRFFAAPAAVRAKTVSAGTAKTAASRAAKNTKIPFTDGSGQYLTRRGKVWTLYSKKGRPLTGLRYLSITKTDSLRSGYYMFDRKGQLIQKKAVYYFKEKTVAGVTFNGFYCTTSAGRFPASSDSICKISSVRCEGKVFNGYYYSSAYGKLSAKAQVRYLKKVRSGKVTFNGYYYFNKYGQLCTKAAFHKVTQTVNGKVFDGSYYFGGSYGKLKSQKGWVVCNKKKYYIDQNGKMLTDRWKSGYYLQSDGTIATSKKLPDGSYVGYDGRKCSGADMALSSLASRIRSLTGSYRGTWSVYVKDLKTGGVININDRAMSPASTIKAFVMAATFDRIKRGKLSYSPTIRSLMTNMITVSDNESYNALVRSNGSGSFLSGTTEINRYLSKNGYSKTACRHTLHPSSSASAGSGSNVTSAKDCGVLLENIYRGKCVSAAWSKEMLNLLCRQTRRWKIPSGIPSGVKVANKTGENDSVQNDIAIVFGPKTDYVICIFSAVGNESYSNTRIRNISQIVYQYLN